MAEDKIRSLIDDISDDEDRHLIEEAVLSLKAGAFRAAYIMTWIAAAESLKRRIKVVAQRDSVAGKVLGDIEDGEKKHFAVDYKIVEGAFKLGLISDIEKTRLTHIFENRNVFGHPYNTAPNEEDVVAGIRYVGETILMREIKLKHSYVDDRLSYLLNDATYLDDDETKVAAYAEEVAKRVDAGVYAYLFKNYIEGLNKIWNDPEKQTLKRRGMRFCKTFLVCVGVERIGLKGQWLDLMSKYPEMFSWFASWEQIFKQLDDATRDSAVLKNLEYGTDVSVKRLKRLKEIEKNGYLSESQVKHLNSALSRLSGYKLHQTELAITDLYAYARSLLDSYDFACANSGSDFFFSYRIGELNALSEENQFDLGGSLCDAVYRNAFDALSAVAKIAHENERIPVKIRIGYCEKFFDKRVASILGKESLCRSSIGLLFGLPSEDRTRIEKAFSLAVGKDDYADAMLKSDSGKYFVDAYEIAKRDAALPPVDDSVFQNERMK